MIATAHLAAAADVAPSERKPDAVALRDLCGGYEPCRQVVLMRHQGVALVRVLFLHPAVFVEEDEDYCDRREYWHIRENQRTLLARDCAEQSGADSQGPIAPLFERGRLELTYLEWLSSDGCDKSVATIDWQTGKVVAIKRWTGVSIQRRECRRLKPVKRALKLGTGTHGDPVVTFHRE